MKLLRGRSTKLLVWVCNCAEVGRRLYLEFKFPFKGNGSFPCIGSSGLDVVVGMELISVEVFSFKGTVGI